MTDFKLRDDVQKFLQTNRVGVIATAGSDGKPQAAAVTYLLDDDFNFYFITRKNSRKLQNIAHNPRVAIVVGASADHAITAQIEGAAAVISDPDHYMITYFSRSITLNETDRLPLRKIPGMEFAFVHVKIDWLRWLNLDNTNYPETYKEDFQQVIP